MDMRYQVNLWVHVKEQVFWNNSLQECYMDHHLSVISNSHSDNDVYGLLT